MAKLIEVQVFKKNDLTSYPNARVSVSGMSKEWKTDHNGKVLINYPYDTGTITIYVEGETAYNGYVSDISGPIIVKRSWSSW